MHRQIKEDTSEAHVVARDEPRTADHGSPVYKRPVVDSRTDRLARLIVEYSLGVSPGQVLRIDGGAVAEPLLLAAYAHALNRVGAAIEATGTEHYFSRQDA